MRNIFRRRQLIINYRLQLTLILHTLLVALVTAACVHVAQISASLDEVYIYGLGVISTQYLPYLVLPVLAGLVFWGFLISNRIAGPIFNLQRHIGRVLEGQTDKPAQCRNSDYFKDLFVTANRLVDAYRETKKGRGP